MLQQMRTPVRDTYSDQCGNRIWLVEVSARLSATTSVHHSSGLDLLIPHSNHLPIILHGDDIDSSREDIVKGQSTGFEAGFDIEDGALLFPEI